MAFKIKGNDVANAFGISRVTFAKYKKQAGIDGSVFSGPDALKNILKLIHVIGKNHEIKSTFKHE